MVYRIVCPKQQPETFELDACYHCPRFQVTIKKGEHIAAGRTGSQRIKGTTRAPGRPAR